MSNILFYEADNFKIISPNKKSIDITAEMVIGSAIDERHFIVSTYDPSDFKWYENYLAECEVFYRKNQNCKPSYLLDIGYVPLIMFPSCFSAAAAKLNILVDAVGIPNIKLPPYSFITGYTKLDMTDVWVHKLDMAEYLRCKPEDVRSINVFRKVVQDVGL